MKLSLRPFGLVLIMLIVAILTVPSAVLANNNVNEDAAATYDMQYCTPSLEGEAGANLFTASHGRVDILSLLNTRKPIEPPGYAETEQSAQVAQRDPYFDEILLEDMKLNEEMGRLPKNSLEDRPPNCIVLNAEASSLDYDAINLDTAEALGRAPNEIGFVSFTTLNDNSGTISTLKRTAGENNSGHIENGLYSLGRLILA